MLQDAVYDSTSRHSWQLLQLLLSHDLPIEHPECSIHSGCLEEQYLLLWDETLTIGYDRIRI